LSLAVVAGVSSLEESAAPSRKVRLWSVAYQPEPLKTIVGAEN
jgi:hypothetical protein